ncbi:hypothetical protein jhhlp_005885 [Lomentospora prolificans]|uniref:Mannan endo-1,6-alpha-mannosidase n=1 Tax=Lomentospora prolificans TaxID=41688 RepID=A0A2N3N4C7_9PEZI|nr:hypothetical protein jhhlp_005885 [Lomentospora prolificans]
MGYYNADSSRPVGRFPSVYFWASGSIWATLVDYQHYTGDESFNKDILAALSDSKNIGPNKDYLYETSDVRTTDDIATWALAALAAAERNLPQPNPDVPSWLTLAENSFNYLSGLWDADTCGGGINWALDTEEVQLQPYKSTLTIGAVFQLAARLARATGDENGDFASFANQVWDWSVKVGFVDPGFNVYDGALADDDCSRINKVQFSHTAGLYLLGSAVMANVTGDEKWIGRAQNLTDRAIEVFFGGEEQNVLTEVSCESVGSCTDDMAVMKGSFASALWRSTQMLPSLDQAARPVLESSAQAAVAACTEGDSGEECPMSWVDKSSGGIGAGEQASVLALVQGLLISESDAPYSEGQVDGGSSSNGSGDSNGSSGSGSGGSDESGAISMRASAAVVVGSFMLATLSLI